MTSDKWSQLAALDMVRVNKWSILEGRRKDVEAVKRISQEWVEYS